MLERANRTKRSFIDGEGPDPGRLRAALGWLQNEATGRGVGGVIVAPDSRAAQALTNVLSERAVKVLLSSMH